MQLYATLVCLFDQLIFYPLVYTWLEQQYYVVKTLKVAVTMFQQ